MLNPKARLTFLIAAALFIASFVSVSCGDNNSGNDQVQPTPTDTIDTSKMDTATTRPPVKTNN